MFQLVFSSVSSLLVCCTHMSRLPVRISELRLNVYTFSIVSATNTSRFMSFSTCKAIAFCSLYGSSSMRKLTKRGGRTFVTDMFLFYSNSLSALLMIVTGTALTKLKTEEATLMGNACPLFSRFLL